MKHKIAKVRAGLYNYRGYNIHGTSGAYVMKDEEGAVAHRTKTVRAMKAEIDEIEKAAHEASAKNERNYAKVC